MSDLSDPDLGASRSGGARTGSIGGTAGNGRPPVAPVSFLVEDGTIVVSTGVVATPDATA